jgi:CRISPR/Cas system-associated endonuclease Cas1
MQLVINTYGSYLQRNGDCFKVKTDEKVFEISCKKVSSILISTAAYITTYIDKLQGRNIKRDNIIQFDCHRIANELIGDKGEAGR